MIRGYAKKAFYAVIALEHAEVVKVVIRGAGGRGLISMWDSFQTSIIRISHFMEKTECEVMQMCYKLDQQKLFSNGKRATKYEANIEMDYPKGFNDKPILP